MTEPVTEENYIPRTAGATMPTLWDDLPPIPLPVKRTARVLADVVGVTQYAVGKAPSGVALACIYVAELIHNRENRLSQPKLAGSGIASPPVMREHTRAVPRLFLEHAGEDAQRLGDPVAELKILREFAEVEAEGGSFPSLPRFQPGGDRA